MQVKERVGQRCRSEMQDKERVGQRCRREKGQDSERVGQRCRREMQDGERVGQRCRRVMQDRQRVGQRCRREKVRQSQGRKERSIQHVLLRAVLRSHFCILHMQRSTSLLRDHAHQKGQSFQSISAEERSMFLLFGHVWNRVLGFSTAKYKENI